MGRNTKGKDSIDRQGDLFGALQGGKHRIAPSLRYSGKALDLNRAPLHTSDKSKLICEYISKYQLVTHGGLFIDGFSAPQRRQDRDAWTARRVLELEPKWIRAFWLCDLDPIGIELLGELKRDHHRNPKSRTVSIEEGDFNKSIHLILKSPRIRKKTPVFALLDQRNTECHWSSVQAIAARAGVHKIEMLYFLGTSWLHRSLSQSYLPERIREIDLWWGGPGWHELIDLSQPQIVERVAERFSKELGYKFVTPYPLLRAGKSLGKVFYLIHASDHPDAPKLMTRAYRKIVGSIPGTPTDLQKQLF